MLLEIPKRSFHIVAIERHSAKYLKRLEEYPQTVALQATELEIIPYEKLWEIVLKTVKGRPQRETETLRRLKEI